MQNKTTENLPFADDGENVKKTQGVKLSNKKSKFAEVEKKDDNFEENASKLMNAEQRRNQKATELSRQLLRIIEDKTLPQNKTHINKSVETTAVDDLIKFLIGINDETESDLGTAALFTLIVKIMLKQRDKINEYSYRLEQLENQVKGLLNKDVK